MIVYLALVADVNLEKLYNHMCSGRKRGEGKFRGHLSP